MNTYSDNQTGHLYVLSNAATSWTPGNDVVISDTVDHKFNIKVKHNNVVDETTDQLDDRYILSVTCKEVTPVYYRKWTVEPLTNIAAKANTTYSLFFYLENMLGFGLQDRWDLAATYKTGSTAPASFSTVLGHLAFSLYGKLNVEGPIKNDFTITVDSTTIDSNAWEAYGSTGNLPSSMNNATNIVIAENPASPTYHHTDHEILMGSHPYEYDLTLSTYEDQDNAVWNKDNKRRITAESTGTARFASGVVVKDMENFFMRNRKDLYSLTPNFNVSIINEGNADRTKYYSIVNVHYAFSDNLGFSYFSEKDLNIAVVENSEGAKNNGDTLKALIEGKTLAGKLDTVNSIVTDTTMGNAALNNRINAFNS